MKTIFSDLKPLRRFLPKLEEIITPYFQTLEKGQQLYINRKDAVRKRNEAAAQLELTVRHFWTVVTLRTERLKHDDVAPTYYYPYGKVERPKKESAGVWVELGKHVLEGERMAIAQGLPPMTNPGAEDVGAAIAPVEAAVHAVDQAQKEFGLCLTELEECRPKAAALVEEIAENMKRALKAYDPPRRRRIMRAYGFRFKTDKKPRLPKSLEAMIDLPDR
ncbi:MAG: hypothetical protein QNK37_22415 [Acidobacteriota bacterium]|nr:hypothetical protein [Acidobacteriota bacterium]